MATSSLSKDLVLRLLGDSKSAEDAIKAAADSAEVSVSAYKKAQRELAKQQAAEQAAARARKDALDEAGKSSLILGAALLTGFGIAVKAAADFDKSMSGVAAATMTNAKNLDELRQAALKAGADTMYSATEAADAETELAKAGLSVHQILAGGLIGSLNLAAAGQLDVASAASITATTLSQFSLQGSAASHVADLLAAGANKSLGSVTDLAGALKYVGPVAGQMGVSVEQATGALALMAQQGIIGEQAGTSLRGVLSALVSPSLQAAQEMKNLGINVFDAQGNFLGLDGVAGQLQKSLGGMTEEQRSAALGIIFGNEQLTAARVLYAAGAQGVDEWTAKVDQSGYAAQQAAKLTDNLAGDVERLGGSLSTVLIQGGTGANEVLRLMTQAATGLVNGIGDLPAPLQETVVGLAGVTGVGASVLGIIASMSVRIGEFRDRMEAGGPAAQKFSQNLGRVGSAVGKISVVGGTIIGLYELDKAFNNLIVDAFNLDGGLSDVQDALDKIDVGQLVNDIKALGTSGNTVGYLKENFRDVDQLVRQIHDSLSQSSDGGNVQLIAQVQGIDKAFSELMDNGQVQEALDSFNALQVATARQGISQTALADAMPGFVSKLQDYVGANQKAADAEGGNAAAADEVSQAYEDASASVKDLKDAFDALNGPTLDLYSAQAKLTETQADLKKEFVEGKAALDRNTESGAKNWDLIKSMVSAAEDLATATYGTTGSYDDFSGSLQTSRDNLVQTLTHMNISKQAAEDLANAVIQIPPQATVAAQMDATQFNATNTEVNTAISVLKRTGIDIPVSAKADDFFATMNAITTGKYQADVSVKYVTGPNSQSSLLNQFYSVPHRAGGGPVDPDRTYLVGEKGPELVRFGAPGFVTPADLTSSVLSTLRQPQPAFSPVLAQATAGPAAATPSGPVHLDIDLNRLAALVAAIADRRPAFGQLVVNEQSTAKEALDYATATARTRP